MSMTKSVVLCLLLLVLTSTTSFVNVHAKSGIDLNITVTSDKRSYYYREPIKLVGNFIQNGLPVSNGTVGVAIYHSSSLPIAFRAVKTGQTSLESLVDFVDITPCDGTGVTIDNLVPQQLLYLRFTLKNYDLVVHSELTTFTIFDANGIPLATRFGSMGLIDAGATPETFFSTGWMVPASAQPGNATIVACVFTSSPKDRGVPYGEEKKISLEIKRNPEIDYSAPPMTDPSAPNGSFASSLKLTNELEPGDYQVYVSARSTLTNDQQQQSQLTTQNTTHFSIVNAIIPPQAAFTYYPVDSYVNMSITFDASASTAEGYGVSIVSYTWDFGDGSPKLTRATSTTTHTYAVANNYTVTLNVTDSQGLWSTTSKPVAILPPTGPQAIFMWYPATPKKNQQVTFDATSSKPGWNGTDHPPIVYYSWNFGDGNITSGVDYVKIVHTYIAEGNYSVQLNVTDASGFKGYSAPANVQVRIGGIAGDINGDGVVDIYDAILMARAYGSKPGDPNWNPNADLNSDHVVDIYDAIMLSNHYGQRG